MLAQLRRELPEADPVCLERWVRGQLDRCEDRSWAERFARACPVEGALPEHYLQRVLAGSPALLTGIRFKGGDLEQPFVDLLAWDGPLGVDEAVARSASAWSRFSPRQVRLRWPGEEAPSAAAEVDQWLLAGRARERPRLPKGLGLLRESGLSWLDDFERAFAEWRAGAGPLADEVFPADRDALQRCLDQGVVLGLWADGPSGGRDWAGLIAARRAEERQLAGHCVVEELIAAPWRGRGLGVQLQRGLSERVEGPIWGTIHGLNVASRRTAERAGRRVVESWWFLPT